MINHKIYFLLSLGLLFVGTVRTSAAVLSRVTGVRSEAVSAPVLQSDSLDTEQPLLMRRVFAEMPDSIFVILTKNNRLDCIDFIENNLPAKVENRLGGKTELKTLTERYLDLQLTVSSRVELKLLSGKDGQNYICMARTFYGPAAETVLKLYRKDWTEVDERKWLDRPKSDEYWQVTDSLTEAEVDRWRQMQDMRFVTACLFADSDEILFQLHPGEVEYGESDKMKQALRPIRMVWNGSRFERKN